MYANFINLIWYQSNRVPYWFPAEFPDEYPTEFTCQRNVITVFFGSNLSLSGVTRVLAADAHVFRESEGMGGATPDLGLKTVGTPVPLHLWTCYTMADVSVKSGPVYILEISRHDFNALFPDNSNFVRILISLQCDSGISGNGAFSGSWNKSDRKPRLPFTLTICSRN